MENELFDKAIRIWKDFENDITYRNRYFPKCEFFNILESIIVNNNGTINSETFLYRARIFDEMDDRSKVLERLRRTIGGNFLGYDEMNSGSPPIKRTTAGRANPELIPYLYLADSEYTAMVEVRPFLKSEVSIAKFEINEDLNIVDFGAYRKKSDFESINEALFFIIGYKFATPINSDDKYKYIATQYITEYIKQLGFDGIKYNSSLSLLGHNVALYNSNKVKAIKSEIFSVTEINFYAVNNSSDNIRELKAPLMPTRRTIL